MVALLVFLLQFTRVTHDRWWHQSRLLPTFITAADWLGERVPNNVRQYLRTHGVTPGLDQKASTGGRPPASSATSHAGGNTRPGHAFAR
jgi:membrane protein required for colicin V production